MKFLKSAIFLLTFILAGFALANSASAANVYYSVGQNTTSHETGAGTVTVSGTTATFSVAQTATNMGVGDVVNYDSDNKKCYISGKTSTTVWSCVSATGGTPTAATNVTVNSIAHAFSSLTAALPAGAGGAKTLLGTSDLTSGGGYVLNIPCYYDSAADTGAVTIDGWTTGASNYIKIYTPNNTATEANVSQRHSGVYSTSKYRLEVIADNAIYPYAAHIRIDGIQIKVSSYRAFRYSGATATSIVHHISNCIIQGNAKSGSDGIQVYNGGSGTVYVWNNIIYDWSGYGIYEYDAEFTVYTYNNTVQNCATGIARNQGTVVAVNNLVRSCTDSYYGTFSSPTDYNATDTADIIGTGSNNRNFQTFTFLNETGDDFHLASTDAGARNYGVSDPGSGLFSNDIDGETRSGSWDIGADEAFGPYNAYYSVGQSASDLKTGSPTISISSGAATLSVAQTGNIGVGDVIIYDSTNTAYISGKTSTTVWSVVTATGKTPPNVSGLTVDSIKHTYTTLSSAEAGADDAAMLNTADLVAGNYVLNIPCYYDSAADTTAVTVDGWTTGASNYIKIYTPNNTATEANQSQRHDGKWNTGKYRLEVSSAPGVNGVVAVYEEYVRVDGLQIFQNYDAASHSGINFGYTADGAKDHQASNNIIKGNGGTTYNNKKGINFAGDGYGKAWNNIIYDFKGGSYGMAGAFNSGTIYYYNNTIQNCDTGMTVWTSSGRGLAKNNLFKSCTTAAVGTYNFGSGYNATNNASMNYTVTGGATADRVSQTFTFLNEAGDDFHLSANDAGAKNYGVDLNPDPGGYLNVTDDIGGEARPDGAGTWDIGADEQLDSTLYNVYYSVGQSATDLKTNSPTVTISSGVATFSTAQTGNIGVGDAVTYNTDVVAYISAKQSTTVWNVVTATGRTPSDITGSTVVSIKHAYTSLYLAEEGADDAAMLNNTSLVAINTVLNIPCYYDSAADTTAVTVDGWTTGANNYIKIYTPAGGSESNNSQRHDGKWNTAYYRLAPATGDALTIGDENIRIEGLQFNSADDDGIYVNGATGASQVRISQSVIKGNSTAGKKGINIAATGATSAIKIWNNAIYDYSGSGSAAAYWNDADWTVYAFNNTIQNSAIGLERGNDTAHYAKNNLIQAADAFNGTFTDNDAYNDYNSISENTNDAAIGSHGRYNQTFTFVNEGSDDFHLAATDAGARDFGVSLAGDANLSFQTDIDGEQRRVTWDIGADEAGSAVGITGTTVRNAAWGTARANAPQTSKETNGLILMQSLDGPHMDWSQSTAEARDQSSLGHHGDVVGLTQSSARIGKVGQALFFGGDGYKVTVASSTDFNFTINGGFSNFMWFKKTGACNDGPQGNAVFASRFGAGDGDRTWWFGCWGNADANQNKMIIYVLDGTGNPYIFSTLTINDGSWHFAGWVYDGTNNQVRLYVDGNEQTTAANIAADFTSSNPFCISSYDASCGTFEANNTTLDEVRVYNRALSAGEVDTLYRLGRANLK